MKYTLAATLLILLLTTQSALAATIIIDGTFSDWAGAAGQIDQAADDEAAPQRADITEFRATANSSILYLLMAWDDTAFGGGNATTAGVTVRGGTGTYYRIYATARNNPGSIALADVEIRQCADSTCKGSQQVVICAGAACAGLEVGSGTGWTDPFSGAAGHTTAKCATAATADCALFDTAVELAVPWGLIGGAPTAGQYTFLSFGSYPSGPAQAPKDANGTGNGITCAIISGTMQCYLASPTAIHMVGLSAEATSIAQPGVFSFALLVGILILLVAAILRQIRNQEVGIRK